MSEFEAYCVRVEDRLLIPGKKITYTSRSGLPRTEEYNVGHVLVRANTERYMDKNGSEYKMTSDIPIDDYYFDKGEAVNEAIDLHNRCNCKSATCGWTKGLKPND